MDTAGRGRLRFIIKLHGLCKTQLLSPSPGVLSGRGCGARCGNGSAFPTSPSRLHAWAIMRNLAGSRGELIAFPIRTSHHMQPNPSHSYYLILPRLTYLLIYPVTSNKIEITFLLLPSSSGAMGSESCEEERRIPFLRTYLPHVAGVPL